MSTTISETPQVEEHYLAQFALLTAVERSLAAVWPSLDPTDLAGSLPVIRRAVAALVEQFAQASISTAADYYEVLRAEHVPGGFTAPTIEPPDPERVGLLVDDSVDGLLSRAATVPDEVYLAEIMTQVMRTTEGVAQASVGNAGVGELFAAMEEDRQARGWARVVRPNACYFCRMLATRGPVYRTEGTANFRAHRPRNGRGGVCRCSAEPLFGRYYEPPARVREDEALWDRISRTYKGADAIYEFRRAIEGREDGDRRRKGDDATATGASREPREAPQPLGFKHLTPAQLRHHLAITEALPDSEYRTRQIERLRDRLAELGD